MIYAAKRQLFRDVMKTGVECSDNSYEVSLRFILFCVSLEALFFPRYHRLCIGEEPTGQGHWNIKVHVSTIFSAGFITRLELFNAYMSYFVSTWE